MSNNKITILVVDDEKDLRDIYKLKLINQGYAVIAAENGQEALKIAAATKNINLILLDIVMPQMSGFEVLSQLKLHKLTKKVPVFLLTNLGLDSERQEGFKLKADKYLIKTALTPDKIVEVINRFFKKK